MPTLHLLGTGAGYSEPHRTTTMLALSDEDNIVVIDCGGDVTQRMLAVGLDPMHLKHLILTHSHPDHISGFPLLMEKLWLVGRRQPLPIYGPADALDHARRLFEVFDTSGWKGLQELQWHPVSDAVMEDDAWCITAAPVVHSVPTLGFRIICRASGAVVAYSCDTEPSQSVVALARDADLLLHDATGPYPNHSSPEQAAEIARAAGAKKLVLVHLAATRDDAALANAQKIFPETEWGTELGRYGV